MLLQAPWCAWISFRCRCRERRACSAQRERSIPSAALPSRHNFADARSVKTGYYRAGFCAECRRRPRADRLPRPLLAADDYRPRLLFGAPGRRAGHCAHPGSAFHSREWPHPSRQIWRGDAFRHASTLEGEGRGRSGDHRAGSRSRHLALEARHLLLQGAGGQRKQWSHRTAS